MTHKRTALKTLAVVVSVAMVLFAGYHLDWPVARSTVGRIDWIWLALGLVLFLFAHVVVALRFRKLLVLSSDFTVLLGISNLHSMFNYLMPAKLGEISFPLLLSQRLRLTLSMSTAALATARVLDLGAIALVLPVLLVPLYERLPGWIVQVSVVYCVAIITLSALMVIYVRRTRKGPENDPMGANQSLARLRHTWRQVVHHLQIIDESGGYLKLSVMTLSVWGLVYAYLYCIVLGLGFEASFLQMMVTSVFLVPLTLLPVQGFANIGTHEAAWVSAFVLFGSTAEEALTVAVLTHIVLFLFVVILGASGYCLSRGNSGHVARVE